MDYSAIIDRLAEDIRRYRIESQRFFTGDSQVPPEKLRSQIRKRLTSLIGQPRLSSVDQFRLGALESRYHSLTELARRRMRDDDLAHRAGVDSKRHAERTAAVELGRESSIEDVEGLYQTIYAERGSKVDIGSFHAYLESQASEMRDRTGCDKVRFSVESESGEPKLKARPVKLPSLVLKRRRLVLEPANPAGKLRPLLRADGVAPPRQMPDLPSSKRLVSPQNDLGLSRQDSRARALVALKLTVLTLAVVLPTAPLAAAPQSLGEAIAEHRRLAEELASPGVLNDLANLLVLDGDREEAESIYRRVLSTDPANTEAQFNLGLLLQNSGQDEEAEELFRSVLDGRPHHQWAHYQLGAIYESRGERRGAIDFYSQALAFDPELFFADVNPQVVTNGLLTEAILEAARLREGVGLAPLQYSRPREITQMLLSLPVQGMPPSETAPAEEEAMEPEEEAAETVPE